MLCIAIAEFWMNLQSAYDLRKAEQENAARIRREVRPLEQAANPLLMDEIFAAS
jgi:plasmid maintenance system antidote protein VapI